MANQLNDKARTTATKLLSKFGAIATLSKTIPGVYDPITQSVVNTSVDYNIFTYPDKPSVGLIQGGMATISDIVFTVAPFELGVLPLPNDTILFNGKTYMIVRDVPIYGGNDIALHILVAQIR